MRPAGRVFETPDLNSHGGVVVTGVVLGRQKTSSVQDLSKYGRR